MAEVRVGVFERHAVAAAIYAMCAVPSVGAQAVHEDEAQHVDEVTITARALEGNHLVAPAQQISGAALAQRQASTLGETLEGMPGVSNSSFGPNVGRPILRGMDGDRTMILQNGGANLDVSGLSNDHAVPLDPLTTERIEILHGPATLLYGNSAMGGVVNVIDNRIARERSFDAQGGVMGKAELRAGGATQERSKGAMVEAGNDKWVLHVDGFDRSTENMRVPKEMTCNGTPNGRRVCNSASDTQGAAVGGTMLFDRGYLGVSSSVYRNQYGTVAEPDVNIGMRRHHHVVEGLLRDVGGFEDVKFQWGQTDYSHTEFATPGATTGTRFENQGHDFRIEGHQHAWRLSNGLRFNGVVGLQGQESQVQSRDEQGVVALIPLARTQSTGVFTYQALTTSWGELSVGARTEAVTVRSLEASGPNAEIAAQTQSYKPLSVALGAMRDLREGETPNGWQLTTNWSASQRAPKDYELFAHGEHAATGTYEIGQPTLGLEKGSQWDGGGEYKRGAHKVGVTGFVSEFSNYISLQPTGGNHAGMPDYVFQGVRARFYGLESSAKLRLVGGEDAALSAKATHGTLDMMLRADVVHATDVTHNQAMPRMAPMRLGADAVWAYEAWGARVGVVHAAAQNRVPDGDVTTASYTLWNAGLNYHAHTYGPTHWLWFAKLDNITNKLAYSSTSVLTQTMGTNAPPLAGRSLKLGVQVSF